MLFLEFFLHERFLEIWLGQGSVTDKRTDGRTDIHGGKNNICLPQGETYNSPYHHQTNSVAERAIGTAKQLWRKPLEDGPSKETTL